MSDVYSAWKRFWFLQHIATRLLIGDVMPKWRGKRIRYSTVHQALRNNHLVSNDGVYLSTRFSELDIIWWNHLSVCRYVPFHIIRDVFGLIDLLCLDGYSISQEICTRFCFAVLCFDYTLTDFPISIRLTSLTLWQSNDCSSASKATLMNMDKYFMWIHYERLHNHNKAKHNKTVCIFLGIYLCGPGWICGSPVLICRSRW